MSNGAAAQTPPRVFISYSHDSDAHRKRVLALAERLRDDGIDADLDQYVKGTPPEKWPRWMLNRLNWADFVLLVCTSTYYRRFLGHEEPEKGKGVDWEGAVITDAIYDDRSATLKFVPVLFDLADQRSIPEPVRGRGFFCLTPEIGYRRLYDLLLGQSGTEPRPLGQLKRKARDRAEPLTFPGTEGKPTRETATTPAQLWPDHTLAGGSGEATNCYVRLHAICAGGDVPGPEERRSLWQTVRQERPSSFLAWQLAAIARWGAPEYLEVDAHFTPLQVQVRARRDEGPAEKQQIACDTLAEAMTAVFEEQQAPASIIFAPPGGGKSTLLRHYQLQQARRLDEEQRLVLYVQLRDYRPEKLPEADPDTELPALAWLESEWRRETGQAPPLAAFLRQYTLTLLLDGLNEIPRRSDAEYRARVGEWQDLIETVDHDYPGVRLLFACRPLDYTQPLDQGRHTRLPEIEVQAMESERIKTFIDKRFDARSAAQVWAQLEDRPALALYSSPYALNLLLGQIDTAAGEIAIPQERAALFSGMVRARLRRECQKGSAHFTDPALLSAGDRTVLMRGKPGAHWLPEDTPLFEALAALAFHIQDSGGSNERWGSLRRKEARKVMAAALQGEPDTDTFLQAGYALGLFEDESAQAGEIRFVHQQMQEYFAAWLLAEDWDAAKLAIPWRSADLPESTETLLARGGDTDLPELPSTGWEESALMAASLCARPEAFVRDLIPANLALAGRCAAQPDLKIAGALRGELRKLLIARTQDLQADLRARIAAGKALGELGDLRFERRQGPRGAYLLPPVVSIQPGTYPMGSEEGLEKDWAPAHEVTLPGFALGRFPVTNAEWRCFMDARGYEDERWWESEPDRRWRRGEGTAEGPRQRLREIRQRMREDPELVRRLHREGRFTSEQAEKWEQRRTMPDDGFEALLAHWYRPGRQTQPASWNDPAYNHPAQPVVGICWHEARAYCAWLSDLTGGDWRLPSEAEWEAAARGARGRRYPWGDAFDHPARCNTFEAHVRGTTPVGVFPGGDTHEGIADLAGNVWEWTGSLYRPYPYVPGAGCEDPEEADGFRVVRGSSWYLRGRARAVFRGSSHPFFRFDSFGFRVLLSSPIC